VAAPTAGQREAFDAVYGVGRSRWAFHDDPDPLVRYLRDRRLALGLERLEALTPVDRAAWTVLVVCGGVGGEATWLLDNGFAEVTVSDFSANALAVCAEREPRATTLELDAEGPAVGDSSYDLVLVQDGLHHLRRPVLGFTEMLRVARRAVVVIEPHDGLVGRLLGRTWEEHDGVRNYVFRWTGRRRGPMCPTPRFALTRIVSGTTTWRWAASHASPAAVSVACGARSAPTGRCAPSAALAT
jgi:SAM-dependent methyltransferase